MLQPDAITQQVWQGRVPADWQILHGKRTSPFLAGCFATFLTLVLLFILGIFAIVLTGFQQFGSAAGPSSVSSFNPTAVSSSTLAGLPDPAVLGGALAVALAVGIITALIIGRDAGDPDPLLVILPNGFVEYVSHRKPIISIPFAEIADIDLRTRTTRTTSTNPSTGLSTTTTRTYFWLDLRYRNGRKERWMPRANFGRRLDVCQTIIKAHSRFQGFYGRGR